MSMRQELAGAPLAEPAKERPPAVERGRKLLRHMKVQSAGFKLLLEVASAVARSAHHAQASQTSPGMELT